MKAIETLVSAIGFGLSASVLAAPAVEVKFIDPARYADATPSGSYIAREREQILTELRSHLQTAGARYLGSDDRLAIEVLDVDLAGALVAWRARDRDVRVLRETAIPRVRLHYSLIRGGVESHGEEDITDPSFLQSSRCSGGLPLCYEKQMLDRWFARLMAARPQPSQ
ncbi:MAG TPA: DUF3016 domain-containing protein [Lysobacter sp.]|nr:DUF3016 domain-containing protein [Lysobacter sp.]